MPRSRSKSTTMQIVEAAHAGGTHWNVFTGGDEEVKSNLVKDKGGIYNGEGKYWTIQGSNRI